MKHTFFLLLLFLSSTLNAQSIENLRFSIALQDPESLNTKLNQEQIDRYQAKLEQVLTNQGILSFNVRNNVVIYPKLVFINEQIINPGLQTLNVIDSELYISIAQPDGGAAFANYSLKIKGSGRNSTMAINNLISNINLNTKEFRDFIDKGKTKIVSYYNTNCSLIIKQANQLNLTNSFEESLGLLMSIPMQTDCYGEAQSLIQETFSKYQNRNCKTLLLQAKSLLANNNYEHGFETLAMIDPLSTCSEDVKTIIQSQSKEIDTQRERGRQWQYLNNIYSAKIALAQYRTETIDKLLFLYSQRNPYYLR